ncbi:AAA family ATPase [Methanonatronarchaeum sp. AMET6-2]|uniref:AAA family ATPase n=1 Tax=Methanonatronarchaeum sp. AMET6-2 TaxID=2933293 RepID=UPI001229499F|nr:AAA family ATPase [Methanonatronarchaeum sp. AMET6-2]RZN60860.1 MAG: AAA family ATPase [Methanonatronarchaeia archaeon]UOY09559.1 AAA family ATPase [Methanonatronarchaeum sp. AMET6-2]
MTKANAISYSTTELKEKIDNDDIQYLHKHMGLVQDRECLDLLSYLSHNWPAIHKEGQQQQIETPPDFMESELAISIIKREATSLLNKAVIEGNISVMKRVSGPRKRGRDISGIQTLRKIERKMDEPVWICYVYGNMGTGKTDLALLLSELWKSGGHGREIGSNIKSFEEKQRYIKDFPQLKTWLSSNKKEKIFVFDEASSHVSGYGSDSYDATKYFSKLLKKFRKHKAHLVIIGHTGKDVHPDIRRLATDKIKKLTKKDAVFCKEIGTDGEPEEIELEIKGIPRTNYTFDTYESTGWQWKPEEDTLTEKMEKIAGDIKKEDHEKFIKNYKTKKGRYIDKDVLRLQHNLSENEARLLQKYLENETNILENKK